MENAPYVTSAESDTIKISIATTPEEKKEIYHLRYTIYAEEIGYNLVSVDHENKLLYDELDEWGTIFYAKIGSKYIGTVRVNIGKISDFSSEIVATYFMDRFQKFYKRNEKYNFGLVTKGMVSSPYRKFPVFTMLMTKVFETYCENHVHFGFGNCNFHLLPLHEHYGHRRIGKNIVEPNLGLMASFVVLPDDIHHLQRVNSSFLKIALAKGKTQNKRVVDWFLNEFSETLNIVNSQFTTEESFWEILSVRLRNPPNEVIPILEGLSQSESKKFLYRCGVIIQCPKGDHIVTRKNVSQELIILLSGTISSSDSSSCDKTIAGQHFGAIGLASRTKHTSSVMAATDTEILVLSYHFFLKFRHAYPDIACKILHNLNLLHYTAVIHE